MTPEPKLARSDPPSGGPICGPSQFSAFPMSCASNTSRKTSALWLSAVQAIWPSVNLRTRWC